MPRGKVSEKEKDLIKILPDGNWRISKIAQTVNRSRHPIRNFLRSVEDYTEKKRSGKAREPENSEEFHANLQFFSNREVCEHAGL